MDPKSLYLATRLAFKLPDGGVPRGTISVKFSVVSKRMARVPNGVETLPNILTGWVARTRATNRRQTDGRQHIPNVNVSSCSRSVKITFICVVVVRWVSWLASVRAYFDSWFGDRKDPVRQEGPLGEIGEQELIRRWDSERELLRSVSGSYPNSLK